MLWFGGCLRFFVDRRIIVEFYYKDELAFVLVSGGLPRFNEVVVEMGTPNAFCELFAP